MAINLNEMSLIDRAKNIALDVHSGQYRKVSKNPYYIHPFRVYQSAKQMGYNKDIQVICLLHDVYEDAKNKEYAKEKIKSIFGEKILTIVILLSHDKDINYNEYVLALTKKSKYAGIVKLLDMYENIKDNPSKKQIYKYLGALKYLINNKVNIDTKLINLFKPFLLKYS